MAPVAYFLYVGLPAFLIPTQITSTVLGLKGGGGLGYKLGFAGVVMLLAAQLYIARIGSGRRELLDMHCYLSTAGGALILIHSGFPFSFTYGDFFAHIHLGLGVEGLVGVQGLAAWLVLVLMISGLFGRYLYSRIALGWRRIFRRWLIIHVALSGSLYVAGLLHLLIAVQIGYVSAA